MTVLYLSKTADMAGEGATIKESGASALRSIPAVLPLLPCCRIYPSRHLHLGPPTAPCDDGRGPCQHGLAEDPRQHDSRAMLGLQLPLCLGSVVHWYRKEYQ